MADAPGSPIAASSASPARECRWKDAAGAPAVTVDATIGVSDPDNSTLPSATVSITSGFHNGDVLAFTNAASSTYGNVVGSYDSSTGVLTLTSSGATTTDAQWASALSAVTFSAP